MSDAISKIRHDYTASKNSGTRPVSAIKVIAIHDAEVDDDLLGAEKVGDYFESRSAGGSTHYGVDDNTTQQYLADNVVPWGAPGANKNGLHIELMGKASHTRAQWLDHHGPMFERAAWLIATKAKAYGIPIRLLTVAEFKAGKKGIVTHNLVSVADGPGGSTHTDPGRYFPIDVLLQKAIAYANAQPSPRPQPLVRSGSVGGAVRTLQKRLLALGYKLPLYGADGDFGDETRAAVIAFQKKTWPKDRHEWDGVVGKDTWKALGY